MDMYSRSLSCTCFCGQKIFSQNQAQKDSESTSDNYGGNYVQGKTYRICKQDEFKKPVTRY